MTTPHGDRAFIKEKYKAKTITGSIPQDGIKECIEIVLLQHLHRFWCSDKLTI